MLSGRVVVRPHGLSPLRPPRDEAAPVRPIVPVLNIVFPYNRDLATVLANCRGIIVQALLQSGWMLRDPLAVSYTPTVHGDGAAENIVFTLTSPKARVSCTWDRLSPQRLRVSVPELVVTLGQDANWDAAALVAADSSHGRELMSRYNVNPVPTGSDSSMSWDRLPFIAGQAPQAVDAEIVIPKRPARPCRYLDL